MEYPHCDLYGFNEGAIKKRLLLLELTDDDLQIARILHDEVIRPNVKQIVDRFYDDYLLKYDDFKRVIGTPERVVPLKKSQAEYLLSLGLDFNTREYFEKRLRVGVAHDRVGLTLSLYECAYHKLRELICHSIGKLEDDQKICSLRSFVAKVISLDMSLAIESYHRGVESKLASSVKSLKDQQVSLQKKAGTDYLTGFYTREALLNKLEAELDNSKKSSRSLSIVMVCLDNLGKVNDQYGHLIGDHVMREISRRMQKLVAKNDIIGRYGGVEFMILLPGMAKDQANKFAENLRASIASQPLNLKDNKVTITTSIGVCDAAQTDKLASLIAKVDMALLTAKKEGGNKVVVYS